MSKNKTSSLSVIVLCILLSSSVVCFAKKQPKMKDIGILFYGKVVDQYFKPVVKAQVHVDVFQFDLDGNKVVKNVTVKTGSTGLFTINDIGHSIYITSAEKDGYEFLYGRNLNQNFDYCSIYPQAVFVPDRKAPLIFYMRKMKDEPAFLIHKLPFERNFPPTSSPVYSLSLGGTWIDDNGQFRKDMVLDYVDIKVQSRLSIDQKRFELTFISMDSNSGIIVKDELLYQAPAEGYEPKKIIEIKVPVRYEQKKTYVYVKARGGQMYSRIDLELTVRPSNLLVGMEIWTNPNHSRNLKYNEVFQKYVKKKRYDVREHRYQEHLRAKRMKELLSYKQRDIAGKQTEEKGQKRAMYRAGSR